jgi:hypothetical protein
MSNRFGYNSQRWIRQDWRFIIYSGKDGRGMKRFRYDTRCGKKGGVTPTGAVRLCLPRKVIENLIQTREGRDALHEQVKKKLNAPRGSNVQYNFKVLTAFQKFQRQDPFENKPQTKIAQSNRSTKPRQLPLFDFDM